MASFYQTTSFHPTGDTILPKKIGPAETCYLVYMHGMRFDARKVMWRAFTQEEPMYSQEHYRVHFVDKTRKDLLAFNNLGFTIESSTFNQWTKEDENWPWKRSSKGNVPIHLRVKREKKAVRKQKVVLLSKKYKGNRHQLNPRGLKQNPQEHNHNDHTSTKRPKLQSQQSRNIATQLHPSRTTSNLCLSENSTS